MGAMKKTVLRTADFSNPRPFKTTRGLFHPYTWVPFVGWLPQTEFMLLLALTGVSLAIALPQPTILRKAIAFFAVFGGVVGFFAALALLLGLLGRLARRKE